MCQKTHHASVFDSIFFLISLSAVSLWSIHSDYTLHWFQGLSNSEEVEGCNTALGNWSPDKHREDHCKKLGYCFSSFSLVFKPGRLAL